MADRGALAGPCSYRCVPSASSQVPIGGWVTETSCGLEEIFYFSSETKIKSQQELLLWCVSHFRKITAKSQILEMTPFSLLHISTWTGSVFLHTRTHTIAGRKKTKPRDLSPEKEEMGRSLSGQPCLSPPPRLWSKS